MPDGFWRRIPATAVNPFDAFAMRALLRKPQAGSEAATITPVSDTSPDRRTLPPGFTPVPPDVFEQWRQHAQRGLMGLFEALTERPSPSMYFPVGLCKDTCAKGKPEQMEKFCREHTKEGTRNRARCWRAVEHLAAGDKASCESECNSMHHNWGR